MLGNPNLPSTDGFIAMMRSMHPLFRMERVRFVEPGNVPIEHIATPPPRWHHHESFMCDGLRFDVWINWDGRVRIEHDGEIILAMWAPAGDILRDIEARRQANQT